MCSHVDVYGFSRRAYIHPLSDVDVLRCTDIQSLGLTDMHSLSNVDVYGFSGCTYTHPVSNVDICGSCTDIQSLGLAEMHSLLNVDVYGFE